MQSLHVCAFEEEWLKFYFQDFTSETPAVCDPYFGLPSADDAQVWGVWGLTMLLKIFEDQT